MRRCLGLLGAERGAVGVRGVVLSDGAHGGLVGDAAAHDCGGARGRLRRAKAHDPSDVIILHADPKRDPTSAHAWQRSHARKCCDLKRFCGGDLFFVGASEDRANQQGH